MRKFDTKVQHLKYKVLREVARLAWEDKLLENVMDSILKEEEVSPLMYVQIQKENKQPKRVRSSKKSPTNKQQSDW